MADIARIGFEAKTDDLDKAKSKLEALVPAAKGAAAAANSVNSGLKAVAGGAQSFTSGVQRAAAGATGLNKATLMASSGMRTVQSAAAGATGPLNALGGTVTRIGLNFAQADAHVEMYKQSLLGVPAAAQNAKTSLDRLGASANDNINRLQSTPGNIAAQFQDIGVTAAGGMSPLLIALQQGTQLSSAMAGGMGNLLAGFAQLFSLTTLLTIGLVGLAAALLQNIDWMGLAKDAMYLLADALEAGAEMIVYFGVVALIAFAPKILAMIGSMTVAIGTWLVGALKSATLAMWAFALANPFAAFVIAVGLAIAAIAYFARDFEIMGHNVIDTTKNAANWLINSFIGAYKGIKAAWSQLPAALGDIVFQVVNRVIQGAEAMINGSVMLMNSMIGKLPFGVGDGLLMSGVSLGRVNNPYAGAEDNFNGVVNGAIRAEQGIDRVGQAAEWATGKFQDFAGWLRSTADGLGQVDEKTKKAAEGGDPKKAGKTDAEKFDDIVAGVKSEIAALHMETIALGMSTAAAMQYRKEHELVQAAMDAGIVLTSDMAKEIIDLAAAWTEAQMTFERTKFMTDTTRAHQKEIAALAQERVELGMTGAALEAYRYEMDLLNDALSKGIVLSDADVAQIKQQAAEYGLATDAIDKFRERIEFTRQALGSFFSEWFNNIRQGQNIFEAFGNSVLSVLDRILSKLTNTLIDNFINNIMGQPMFGGGGPSAALHADAVATVGANPGLFADGGVFGFARGGAFTNSVVSKPTLFQFARGGALGEMGEAGPEAIMPLKRGSDGSLGVSMHGGGGKGGDMYVTVDATSTYQIEGAINAETIVTAIKASGEQTEQKVKRNLAVWLESYQRDGAVS